MSTPFHGFDTGVYTLHIGPEQKKLIVPGYVLTRIPPINKLIIDKDLVENESVSLEAYDPEAFATVLALVRDGLDMTKVPQNSQQLFKSYIVAYDLNLEHIRNFLVNQIKVLHRTQAIEPRDFEVLYAAGLISECKLHRFLLHKMVHDLHTGLYCKITPEDGTILDPEHFQEMKRLTKDDLIQLSYRAMFVSEEEDCALCYDACHFHDHMFTPNCTTIGADGNESPIIPVVTADQLEANARSRIFRFTIKNPAPTTEEKSAQAVQATCVSENSNPVANGLLNQEGRTGSTSYTKVAQWLEETAGSGGDEPGLPTVGAEHSTPPDMVSAEEKSRNQRDMAIDSTEDLLLKISARRTNSESKERVNLRNDLVPTSSQPPVCQETSQGEVSREGPESWRAIESDSTTQRPLEEIPSDEEDIEEVTGTNLKPSDMALPIQTLSLSTHALRPHLTSEVLQSVTKYPDNEHTVHAENDSDGHEYPLEASAQGEESHGSASCGRDYASNREFGQENDYHCVDRSDEQQLERPKERSKNTNTSWMSLDQARGPQDLLHISEVMDKQIAYLYHTLEQMAIDMKHHVQVCRFEAAHFADPEYRRIRRLVELSHGGSNSKCAAALKTLEESSQSRLDAISRGLPPVQPFDSISFDCSSALESTGESDKASDDGTKQKVYHEPQNCVEADDDKEVLHEVAAEIEGFKKELGI